jgi:hypothetical protein
MRKDKSLTCRSCTTTHDLQLCKNCASLSCNHCLINKDQSDYYCNLCEIDVPDTICGSCGIEADEISKRTINLCPVCKNSDLGNPTHLLEALSRDYYEKLSTLNEMGKEIQNIHRLYEKVLTQTLYSRISGLLGFPILEKNLTFLSVLLVELSEETNDMLTNLKKETYYDLRTVDYFTDLSIDLYRVANSKVKSMEERIQTFKAITLDFIENIKNEFKKFLPTFELLHYHRKVYLGVRDILSDHERYVLASLPNVNIQLLIPVKKRLVANLILGEDSLFIIDPNQDSLKYRKIKIEYHHIQSISKKYSPVTGLKIRIEGSKCDLSIRGSNEDLEVFIGYLQIIISSDRSKHQIGSDKDIQRLNNNLPNSQIVLTEISEFLSTVSERLFNNRTHTDYRQSFAMNDVRETLEKIGKEKIHLNNLVKAGKIHLNKYSEELRKLIDLERAYTNLLPSYARSVKKDENKSQFFNFENEQKKNLHNLGNSSNNVSNDLSELEDQINEFDKHGQDLYSAEYFQQKLNHNRRFFNEREVETTSDHYY